MSRQRNYETRQCAFCGTEFTYYQPNSTKQRKFCSQKCWGLSEKKSVTKVCKWCGKTFDLGHGKTRKSKKTRFCGKQCSAKWRSNQPEQKKRFLKIQKKYKEKATEALRKTGFKAQSERMKRMNANPEFKRKATEGTKRRWRRNPTFLSRGGNGQITTPQRKLHEATGYPMEYHIGLKKLRKKRPDLHLPTKYSVDLAIPDRKIVIEIDGESHKTKKWKYLDKRKESVLGMLGWKTLRFWNEEVLKDLESVIKKIKEYSISMSETTITT